MSLTIGDTVEIVDFQSMTIPGYTGTQGMITRIIPTETGFLAKLETSNGKSIMVTNNYLKAINHA